MKVSLTVTRITQNKCYHVSMLINDKDVGILYLSSEELEKLSRSLTLGSFNTDIEFVYNNPFELVDSISE